MSTKELLKFSALSVIVFFVLVVVASLFLSSCAPCDINDPNCPPNSVRVSSGDKTDYQVVYGKFEDSHVIIYRLHNSCIVTVSKADEYVFAACP